MKITRVHVGATLAALCIGAGAHAADQTSAAPKPAAEMSNLKIFANRWSCAGEMNASPFGAAHKTVTSVIGHSDLGGFWVSGKVAESKTAESPTPLAGMFHMTWDSGNKQYLMLWVDNAGGWAQETSAGWQGDTIAFSGDGYGGGQKVGERDSFTRKGNGEFAHSMEINMNGQWTPLGQETCTVVRPHAATK